MAFTATLVMIAIVLILGNVYVSGMKRMVPGKKQPVHSQIKYTNQGQKNLGTRELEKAQRKIRERLSILETQLIKERSLNETPFELSEISSRISSLEASVGETRAELRQIRKGLIFGPDPTLSEDEKIIEKINTLIYPK